MRQYAQRYCFITDVGDTVQEVLLIALMRPKAWSGVWGAGQSVGNIDAVEPIRTLVKRLAREYEAAALRVSATA